jgi:hypothetical protein
MTLAVALPTTRPAHAQAPPPTQLPGPTGAPPPEAKPLVEAPKAAEDAPSVEGGTNGTNVTVSAGGQLVTGNSRLLAGTANAVVDTRAGANGFGASLLGNYGQGAPPGNAVVATTENVQGRLRYDRYVASWASVFLITTGRYDRFQGLDFRLNLDPGFKYLFVKTTSDALWAEAGYDFQYDIRRNGARIELDANRNPVRDASGTPLLLAKTATDSSARFFAGFHHAFNEEVTLFAGLEYLQSLVDATRARLNFDAVFAAKVRPGLAVGFGCTMRFDNAPLPGKENLDTATTVSLIYTHGDIPPAKPQ